ncbi:superantigen-like protein SSL7 [Staphylococcus argenteus]|uniref:superantigen-like protein SSL7 n=1 Tax=Staphylococcus argenteus TaxID=985002 RepID=UPI000504CF8D|nr:superantigen-like protein SSL7 [Staphylococcus argenteus]MBE2132680.1 superantigen-like protein SSL7 [Staphylococcus argenteus]MBE2146713.1 superantigen-like protein SSL7 [Staphylococcus argenteus]MBE2161944.1 superantigen-like protein SSL7 [Staphylococcus argenteus]MCG9797253.1 superantigen-like protein SSL7 [Staphylococcus argenteus]MCG9799234.1 superantigen-like protein SSL7 [Staphylococcus argenteus]
MKLKTLAKATLALGLLTTGVITSEGQAVQAKEKQERVQHLYDIRDLHRYYSAPSFEYSNISGKVENYNGSNVVRFNQEKQNHQLFLLGKDKAKYKEGIEGQDVFVVQELIDPNGRLSTVGGVTKKNNKTSETKTHLLVNKVDGGNLDASIDSFSINKEEVSLKELDFKIRKQLVEKYGLYQGTSKYGKITINLKDEKREVIDLSDKLQFERMGDVLNSKDISGISVTIKQI